MSTDFYQLLEECGEKNNVNLSNIELKERAISFFKSIGIENKRAIEIYGKLIEDWNIEDSSIEKKIWALKKGFLPDKISLFELTEENCKNYLSDVDYFKMHPLNNHFAFWINDKITLKYLLQQPLSLQTADGEKQINLMPEYYLYIENDGHYSYLMDAPKHINKDINFLLNLLKEKHILALKPSRGEGGRGFIKLEYIDDTIVGNGERILEDNWPKFINGLDGYIVTEYIVQHHKLAEICPTSACTLRVVTCKRNLDKYNGGNTDIVIAYARFGTKKSGTTCNLSAGGVGIKFDLNTGEYEDHFYRFKKFLKKEESVIIYRHPDNNLSLAGEKLPNWELVKGAVKAVCEYLSSLEFFGFDIIITEDGVKLCEINSMPSLDYEQLIECPLWQHPIASEYFKSKLK